MALDSLNENIKKKAFDALNLINKANNITLLTHRSPDPDGISSCFALEKILSPLGKNIETIYPNEPNEKIIIRPNREKIASFSINPDLIITLDTASIERLYWSKSFKNTPLINIDHHISNNIKGEINIVDPTISSTCELVYLLINEWNFSIDKSIAEALLYGLLYDTQSFYIPTTTKQTLFVAGNLIEKGANLYELQTALEQNLSPQIITLWKEILENIQFSSTKKTSWCFITYNQLRKKKPETIISFRFYKFFSKNIRN